MCMYVCKCFRGLGTLVFEIKSIMIQFDLFKSVCTYLSVCMHAHPSAEFYGS